MGSEMCIRDSYNALISACEKGKQPERAWEVFQAMQQQGLAQDVITYSALISACEKGKQPERAWEVFQAMQQQGLAQNVITYSALISAFEIGQFNNTQLGRFFRGTIYVVAADALFPHWGCSIQGYAAAGAHSRSYLTVP